MTTIILLMVITNSIFISLKHPLALGILLMVQTILIAILSGLMMSSFWFSYILILIFLGGMLILFIYIAALASNEQFSISSSQIYPSILVSLMIFIMIKMSSNLFWPSTDLTETLIPSASWMFSDSIFPLSLFLIIYLLIVLLAVVKITKFWMGSLRLS